MTAAGRAGEIAALIPAPPADVAPLRNVFKHLVHRQWEAHARNVPAGRKARFITEMYARACYSMLLVGGPARLQVPVRVAARLPLRRGVVLRLGGVLLAGMHRMVPVALHRQLMQMSALMGMWDVLLDDSAPGGEIAVLRVAALITRGRPARMTDAEQAIADVVAAIRQDESEWQAGYWEEVLQPAVRNYCLAEALAVANEPDAMGMGHRWAGIDAAIKGMWYVVGPSMGLARFARDEWNREQQWMADTSLLMQMIDDWVDRDEDCGVRDTPVVCGDWNLATVEALHRKTVDDLSAMLAGHGIESPVVRTLFIDLYNDYLHAALDGMRSGAQ